MRILAVILRTTQHGIDIRPAYSAILELVMCVCAVSYTHLDVYKRQPEKNRTLQLIPNTS